MIIIESIVKNFFNVDLDFSRDEAVEELMTAIDLGDIKTSDIRSELELMLNSEIDWRYFAVNSGLLFDRPEVTNEYAKDYLLYCIHDVAWPERSFKMSDREALVLVVYKKLKKIALEGGEWVSLKELYEEFRNDSSFQDLEFFNMNHAFIDGKGVFDLRIVEEDSIHVFQISLNKSYPDCDIYDVREPNEPIPPYLL